MPARNLLSIAVPDSLFVDEDSLRGKTVKTGQIARAASIFGAERIYIYRDIRNNYDREYETAKQILQYMETPQYLRRKLVSRKAELEFAGLLPPLKIPHHQKESKIAKGEVREAVLFTQSGELRADIGAKESATYIGHGQAGERVTIKVDSESIPFKVSQTVKPESVYWGYEVRRAPSLARFLRSANFELVILTSHLGESIVAKWNELSARAREANRILICFGSPDLGIDRLLKLEGSQVSDFSKSLYLNLFPDQNVGTIRLEEAILCSLSIINVGEKIELI